MRFNLEDLNPGVWFDLVEGEPDQGRICLRVLSEDELRRMDKETIRRKQKRNQVMPDIDIDEERRSRLRWDYCIVDWEGVQDANGVDIPCTHDTKSALMNGSPVFAKIVGDLLEHVQEEQEKRARAELPN